MKVALAAGAAGAAGSLGLAFGSHVLRPSEKPETEVRDTLFFPVDVADSPQWWSTRAGQPIRVTDFGLWQGAPAIWHAEFRGGSIVPFTGLPVLAIRVPRDTVNFQAPTDVELPSGVRLFYDDQLRDIRVVVFYSRCTHFCCRASWHVAPGKPDLLAEARPGPTRDIYGQEPICCLCHYGMFEPMVLEWALHPFETAGPAPYVGARAVRPPPTRPLPVVPVRVESDVIAGAMVYPRWYDAFCA